MKIISLIIALTLSFSAAICKEQLALINNYWLQAAPPNAQTMAAYGEVANNTKDNIILLDAYSPAFEMTMIHQTVIENGVAKMLHQDQLVIKPNEKLVFKQGSYHIMLMHPKFKINKGDKIKINLIFQGDDKKTVQETWFPVEFR